MTGVDDSCPGSAGVCKELDSNVFQQPNAQSGVTEQKTVRLIK